MKKGVVLRYQDDGVQLRFAILRSEWISWGTKAQLVVLNIIACTRVWKATGGAWIRRYRFVEISNSIREWDHPFYIAIEIAGLPAAKITKARLLDPLWMFHLSLVENCNRLISLHHLLQALKAQKFQMPPFLELLKLNWESDLDQGHWDKTTLQ